MKTKAVVFFIVILFLNNSVGVKAQTISQDNIAIDKIKSFYIDYIHSMLQGPTPVNADKMRLIEKKYLTERLINKVGNPFLNMLTNLDPFLKARECDIDWVRTLMVKKNTNKPGSYVATYLYLDDYNKPKSYTKSITYLAVVNENGNIKIDSVW